jgi:hypothetical protein
MAFLPVPWRPLAALSAPALLALLAGATCLTPEPVPDAAALALAARISATDLALATEAHYTRHPSLADRHTPFQDHPRALEHFPTGSVIPPPPHLRAPHAPPPAAPALPR